MAATWIRRRTKYPHENQDVRSTGCTNGKAVASANALRDNPVTQLVFHAGRSGEWLNALAIKQRNNGETMVGELCILRNPRVAHPKMTGECGQRRTTCLMQGYVPIIAVEIATAATPPPICRTQAENIQQRDTQASHVPHCQGRWANSR